MPRRSALTSGPFLNLGRVTNVMKPSGSHHSVGESQIFIPQLGRQLSDAPDMQPAVTGVSNTGLRHGAAFSAGPTHSPTLTSKGSSVALGQPSRGACFITAGQSTKTRRPWLGDRGGPVAVRRRLCDWTTPSSERATGPRSRSRHPDGGRSGSTRPAESGDRPPANADVPRGPAPRGRSTCGTVPAD